MNLYQPAVFAVLALGLAVAPSGAQEDAASDEEEATATHVVMRYWKCSPQGTGVQLIQQGRSVAMEMVEEGAFVDYGVLAHNWGDDWNVIDWFAVDGIDTFFAAFAELNQRVNAAADAAATEASEDELPPFDEVCTAHKDNIYAVVQPPSEG